MSAQGEIPKVKAEADTDDKEEVDWSLYESVERVPLRVVPELVDAIDDSDKSEYVKIMALVPSWPSDVLSFELALCRTSMAGLIKSIKG